ncbi:hypothetical protein [Oricola sp.]|uniref:hypothetical protein n=1 Tax=Oricola sp. TaxID=1979950 RepID=UPI0025F0C3E2|nr:hypothetical protein [Oricola sp.]MCI5078744.1 hypothetical protein [Oricola sp.]
MTGLSLGLGLGLNTPGAGGGSLFGTEYVGQVMGQCHIPFQVTTDTYFNSQSVHYAMDSGSRLKIGIPNWYVNIGSGETNGPGNVTYSAALLDASETVLGQFKFSGSATAVAAPGAVLETDWLSVNYTAGTRYLIRIWGNGASGVIYLQPQSRNPSTNRRTNFDDGNRWESSASALADKTLGGTISNVFSIYNEFTPIYIVGDTRRSSVLMVGDSLMHRGAANLGDYYDGTSPNVGYAERALGELGVAYINLGVPAETAQQFIASHTIRAAMKSYVSHVWCGYGFNDISNGRTSAQLLADLATIYGYFPDNRIVQAIMPYRSSGAWTLADGSDQTVPTVFTPGNVVGTVNAAVEASSVDGVTDYRSAAFDLTTHKWLADGTVGKYTPDGIHSSQFACQAIASSGLITSTPFFR